MAFFLVLAGPLPGFANDDVQGSDPQAEQKTVPDGDHTWGGATPPNKSSLDDTASQIRPDREPHTFAYPTSPSDGWEPLSDLLLTGTVGRRADAVGALESALNRAAEQGILPEATDISSLEDQRLAPVWPDGRPFPVLPIEDAPALRVTTSIDRDLGGLALDLPSENAGACLENHDLDVASWSNSETVGADLGTLRRRLLADFNQSDREAAKALARTYIYWSFGAEARAVLRAFPPGESEMAILGFLAEVADGTVRPSGDPVASLLGCSGRATLWALLSVDIDRGGNVNFAAVLDAFSALPIHLRRHYAPTLVERFLRLGNPDGARAVWSAVNRAPGDHGEGFVLATARLAEAEGNLEEAQEAYANLEGSRPETAAVAVARLIESRLAQQEAFDPSLLETAAAYSFENQGTELAEELKLAELRGRIALNQWDRVFADLPEARFSGALDPQTANGLIADLYEAMAMRAEIGPFLRRALEADRRLPKDKRHDNARRRLSERLLDVGLVSHATRLLEGIEVAHDEDALLWARADILEERYASAVARAEVSDTTSAQRITGQALEGLGRHNTASDVYRRMGDSASAGRAAARAGIWSAAPAELSRAASAVESDEAIDTQETPLARNRALIAKSTALRAQVDDLREVAERTVLSNTGSGENPSTK